MSAPARDLPAQRLVLLTPRMAAREQLAWCVCKGMTPDQACESVRAYLNAPTWSDCLEVFEQRWVEMQAGAEILPVTDRRAA